MTTIAALMTTLVRIIVTWLTLNKVAVAMVSGIQTPVAAGDTNTQSTCKHNDSNYTHETVICIVNITCIMIIGCVIHNYSMRVDFYNHTESTFYISACTCDAKYVIHF